MGQLSPWLHLPSSHTLETVLQSREVTVRRSPHYIAPREWLPALTTRKPEYSNKSPRLHGRTNIAKTQIKFIKLNEKNGKEYEQIFFQKNIYIYKRINA